MWKEIGPLDCFIRYLGFNEGQGSEEVGTDVYVANNAVTSLAGVVPDSQVVRDRFEAIAGNTAAYNILRRYGPYHIVNLDLCGTMFPNVLKDVTPYYNALNKLLRYQFANQKAPWLLFLTTVVEPGVVDKVHFSKLCEPTRANYSDAAFSGRLKGLLGNAQLEGGAETVKLHEVSGTDLIRLFGVALGKWLLHLAHTGSPQWTVEMRRSFQYSIKPEKDAVMLSLAFEMSPNIAPPIDTSGMSTIQTTSSTFPTELECALKLTESVANIKDVDEKLASDSALKLALMEESADLLETAGYDREAYVQWVQAGEVLTPS